MDMSPFPDIKMRGNRKKKSDNNLVSEPCRPNLANLSQVADIRPTCRRHAQLVLGHLWSQNDVIMSWLRLTATSNCFPHSYLTYNMIEHIDMLSIGIQFQHYINIRTLLLGSDSGVLGHLWSQNDVII